jgi:anti-anti-sigma factor
LNFTSRKLADVVVAAPAGQIDHPNAIKLQEALAPFVDASAGKAPLVLDFAGVEYISSMGLRVLMMASKALRARNAAMAIAGLQPPVEEIFDIARFKMVVDVYPTVRDALAAVSAAAAQAYDAA